MQRETLLRVAVKPGWWKGSQSTGNIERWQVRYKKMVTWHTHILYIYYDYYDFCQSSFICMLWKNFCQKDHVLKLAFVCICDYLCTYGLGWNKWICCEVVWLQVRWCISLGNCCGIPFMKPKCSYGLMSLDLLTIKNTETDDISKEFMEKAATCRDSPSWNNCIFSFGGVFLGLGGTSLLPIWTLVYTWGLSQLLSQLPQPILISLTCGKTSVLVAFPRAGVGYVAIVHWLQATPPQSWNRQCILRAPRWGELAS